MDKSTLTTEEQVLVAAIHCGMVSDSAAILEATAIVERLHEVGAHVCYRDCPHPSHAEPLPDVAHARRGDPATSEIAAASIGDMAERHRAVLQVIRTFVDTPWTLDDLVAKYNHRYKNGIRDTDVKYVEDLPKMSDSSIRSRAAELRRAGWIVNTGERGVSDAGGTAILWRAVQ
jgi:hypothetical protein